MQLQQLNALSLHDAETEFLRCCSSQRWSSQVASARPFASLEDLHLAAERIWWALGEEDWLQALAGHPRIGDVSTLAAKFHSTKKWASGEQSGVDGADMKVLLELKALNDTYADKFGFIFVVCATGKTAEEMLEILKSRLPNDKTEELRIAAGEQAKITRIRIDKMLSDSSLQNKL